MTKKLTRADRFDRPAVSVLIGYGKCRIEEIQDDSVRRGMACVCKATVADALQGGGLPKGADEWLNE